MRILAISIVTAFGLSLIGTAQAQQSFENPGDDEEPTIMVPMDPVPDNRMSMSDNMSGEWFDTEPTSNVSGYFEEPMEAPFIEGDDQYRNKLEMPADRCHGSMCET